MFSDDLPRADDVSSIDGIMKAYYEVVSRKAGEPMQSARDKSLHLPQSQVINLNGDASGKVIMKRMTIDDFHEPMGQVSNTGFQEYEISRKVLSHGAQSLVWSTYETRETLDGPVIARGINSIQLYNDGTRWWIVAEMWDSRKGQVISPQFFPE